MKKESIGSEKIIRATTRTLIINIAIFIIILYLIAIFTDKLTAFPTINLETADAVYTINRTDGRTETYDEDYFPRVLCGETLTCEFAPLGDTNNIQNGTLVFSLYHCYVSVYCGDDLIYQQTAPAEGSIIGHRYYVVPLPEGYENEVIRIVAVCSEHDTINSLSNLKIIPADRIAYAFRSGHFATGICMMVLLFGALFMELSSFLIWIQEKYHDGMFSISFLCSSVCLWYMGYSGYFQPFEKSASFLAVVEYIGLYLLAIAIPFFIQNHTTSRKLHVFCAILTAFQAGFFVFATAMTLFVPGVSYVDYIGILRLLLLFMLIVLLAAEFRESLKVKEISGRTLHYGMTITIFLCILELIRFLISEHISDDFPWITTSVTPFCIYSLVFTALLYYGALNTESQYRIIEQENLERLAYIDQLTGAPNRAALYRKIEEMKKQNITNYVITFIDINFLKMINDTWGHDEGDELIRTASDLLNKHFTGDDFFGRWGGDEFIAIHFGTLKETEEIMAALHQDTEKLNASGRYNFTLSAAWGFGESTKDAPIAPEEAIQHADKQMYAAKREVHAARQS